MKFRNFLKHLDETSLFSGKVQAKYRDDLDNTAGSVWDDLIKEQMAIAKYKISMPDSVWKKAFAANPDNPQEYLVQYYPEWAI